MKHEILRIENMEIILQGKTRLRDIYFNVFEGELLAVTGMNNAGKTVLARAIAGTLPFSAARIFRDEQDIPNSAEYVRSASDIFYISREPQLIDSLTVAENIFCLQKRFPLSVFRAKGANNAARALLDKLGLSLSPTQSAAALSPAQKHQVIICRAVVNGARIIILDGISNQYSSEDFLNLQALLSQLENISVIYFTHNSDPILMLADRVALIRGSTITGTLYKGQFSPELLSGAPGPADDIAQLLPEQEQPSSAPPLLSAHFRADGRSVPLHLRAGEILIVQDSRESIRRQLIDGCFLQNEGRVRISGRHMRSYREAVKHGLALIPGELTDSTLFDCMNENENLIFQVMKKTSHFGLTNARMSDYAQNMFSKSLSTEACRSSETWRKYKLCLHRWQLSNCRILVLEDPAAGMDSIILNELLSVLDDLAARGMAILIVASHHANYMPLSGRVLDLETDCSSPF